MPPEWGKTGGNDQHVDSSVPLSPENTSLTIPDFFNTLEIPDISSFVLFKISKPPLDDKESANAIYLHREN